MKFLICLLVLHGGAAVLKYEIDTVIWVRLLILVRIVTVVDLLPLLLLLQDYVVPQVIL